MKNGKANRVREIGPMNGGIQIAFYYRSPNLGICDCGYIIIAPDRIKIGLCNQRYIEIGGKDYPLD